MTGCVLAQQLCTGHSIRRPCECLPFNLLEPQALDVESQLEAQEAVVARQERPDEVEGACVVVLAARPSAAGGKPAVCGAEGVGTFKQAPAAGAAAGKQATHAIESPFATVAAAAMGCC
jgi:hypothetical protein